MTQVETHSTISPDEAVERILESDKAIELGTQNGVGYIAASREDEPGPYIANIPLPFIQQRHTIDTIKRDLAVSTIERSTTAKIVPVSDTPLSRDST